MKSKAQPSASAAPVPITQVLPLDAERLVAEAQRHDEQMLAWLEKTNGGRVYLGELLLRVQGCSKEQREQFYKQGGPKRTLAGQAACLETIMLDNHARQLRSNLAEQVKHAKLSRAQIKNLSTRIDASVAAAMVQHEGNQLQLIGAVIHHIKQTAGQDAQAPKRLREHFAGSIDFQQRHTKQAIKIAMRVWPGVGNKILHEKFCAIAERLSFNKNLLDLLTGWESPRWLARALVNHITGKNREFDKAPMAVRDVVLNVCHQHAMAEVVGLLWQLTEAKLARDKRIDKPSARLKQALESQFRFWEKPSKRVYVKGAWGSAPPWLLDSVHEKHGDKKEMSRRLSDVFERERGKSEAGKFQTYTRYARR